jgi:hemoglobin
MPEDAVTSPQTRSSGSDHALQARLKIQADAAAIGVDEAFISDLVDSFYTSVRQHPALGPVFNNNIQDWGPHLETMKLFWNSVALSKGTYSGKPMQAHMQVRGISRNHFPVWLGLFRQTLQAVVERRNASDDAVEYFMTRAERIAQSLQLGLFFDPNDPMA